MQRKKRGVFMKKAFAIITSIALMGAMFTGCSTGTGSSSSTASTDSTGSTTTSSPFKNLSGSITMDGSSALQPLAQAAADSLKTDNPDLSITVNAGGSGKGLTDIANKSVDIGNSDVFAEDKLTADKLTGLVDHKVCVIGVATVVNPDVTVTNLTKDQLVSIFTGKVKNWKEVGGNDQAIVLVNRPTTSGTRSLFKKLALGGKDEATGTALQQDDSGILEQTVAQTKGAIGYLALSYTGGKTDIKLVNLDGVEPTYDNIYSGKYPVWGYEHMYTNGEATGAVKSFLDYLASSEFASTIIDKGYGDASKMKS
jgi:phosphate transport system substrate-binding protein